jgi:chromosome segregation ATPase
VSNNGTNLCVVSIDLQGVQAQLTAVRDEIASVQAQINELTAVISVREAEIANLQSLIDGPNTSAKERQEYEGQLAIAQHNLSEARLDLTNSQQQLNQLKHQEAILLAFLISAGVSSTLNAFVASQLDKP